jgi:NADPH2 dehydrogenase
MPSLFSPLVVRNLSLRNRVVFPPIATEHATETGASTSYHVKHYGRVAEGGAGLVIVEHSYILPEGRVSDRQLGIHEDATVAGFHRIAEAIHKGGAAACVQITHAGGRALSSVIGDRPVSASAVTLPGMEEEARRLLRTELPAIVDAFVAAARRAISAGFDAVEIHGAHGYLLGQFMSPITNRRNDRYGGSVEQRATLPCEVIQAVRAAVGDDVAILYRFGADDRMPGGVTPEMSEQAAPLLVRAGVDVLDVSGNLCGSRPEALTEQGFFVPLASRIRKASGIPTIGVGNVSDAEYADRAVREMVDLIAVGRVQLANPRWATEAREKLSPAEGRT